MGRWQVVHLQDLRAALELDNGELEHSKDRSGNLCPLPFPSSTTNTGTRSLVHYKYWDS